MTPFLFFFSFCWAIRLLIGKYPFSFPNILSSFFGFRFSRFFTGVTRDTHRSVTTCTSFPMPFSNLLRRYRRQRWLRRRSGSPHLSRSASIAATTTTSYPMYESLYEPSHLYDRLYPLSDGDPDLELGLEWPADLDLDLEPDSSPLSFPSDEFPSNEFPSDELLSDELLSDELMSAQVATFVAPESHRSLRCPVCLEPFEDHSVTTGNCLHLVHTSCLSSWFRHDSAASCPVCRLPLSDPSHSTLPQDVASTFRAQSLASSFEQSDYYGPLDRPIPYAHTYLTTSDRMSSSTDALSSPYDDGDTTVYEPCSLHNHPGDCTHHHYHHHHVLQPDIYRDESIPTSPQQRHAQLYPRQPHHHHYHHHHHHHHLHAQLYASGRTMSSSMISPDNGSEILDAISFDNLPRPYVPLRSISEPERLPSIGADDDVAPWRTFGAVTCDHDQMSSGLPPNGRSTSTSMTVQRWLETVNSGWHYIVDRLFFYYFH